MNVDVRSTPDGTLVFVADTQRVAAALSVQAVMALQMLATVPPDSPPGQHVRAIARQLPEPVAELARLALVATAADGTADLTAAVRRLIDWLTHDWAGWRAYTRRRPRAMADAWGWQIV